MTTAQSSLQELVQRWHDEHRDLDRYMEEVRKWMYQVQQMGVSRFGEMAQRLKLLRQRMVDHFSSENDLGQKLAQACDARAPEVEASKRQATHDHEVLLSRIDSLIEPLSLVDPPFESWQNAFQQMDLIMNELEQHEDQEGESLESLCPRVNFEP